MVKIKQLSIIQTALVVLFGSAFLLLSPFYEQASAAVDPGCYASSATVSSSNEVTKNITRSTCPSEQQTQVDQDQKCFVTSVASGGQTAFVETDCESISLGNTVSNDTSSQEEDPQDFTILAPSLNGPGNEAEGDHYCGKGEDLRVKVSFDIGCLGDDYSGEKFNPIVDMAFALLRFLSVGVGLIVAGSMVWAGIQYSTSRGNPQGTEAAIKRISNAVIALLIYIFSWAILNFLVPGGLFI